MPSSFEEDRRIGAIYSIHLQGRRASQAKNLQKQAVIPLLLVSCLVYSSTLKMEAICSSATLGLLRTTRLYNPEVRILNNVACKAVTG
jgi:hypothetical protein